VGVAINDAGQIAGYMAADGAPAHAFLWTRDVGLVDLAVGFSCDLNSSGDVVGYFFETGHGFLYRRGRVWDLQNDVHPLGGDTWRLIGGGFSINDAGQILGFGYKQGSDFVQGYIMTPLMTPLLQEGFEGYAPPELRVPGWVSDSIRQVPAKSEWNQPHTGDKNGACWTTQNLDCGMYQEAVAPATGTYSLTLYANADRAGGYVGADVNGAAAALMAVDVRGFRNYGAAYTMTFTASQGDTIRVWMYSPATPGYVVIDDVSLTQIE
jgi:probable HAF family extracellular repeat protein